MKIEQITERINLVLECYRNRRLGPDVVREIDDAIIAELNDIHQDIAANVIGNESAAIIYFT